MFPRRYYAGRMFAPRFFPQSQGTAPDVTVTHRATWINVSRTGTWTVPARGTQWIAVSRTTTWVN